MTRRFLFVNTAAIAVAGAVGFGALHFMQRPDAASPQAQTVRIGGPFALTDQHGKRVTDADFRGRYMLVFFGYVFCPDVCPTGLHNATLALQKLGGRAKDVAPIFVTIDPDRDTPAALRNYLSNFHPGFTGLTGGAADIKQAAGAYRVAYGKEDGKGDNYLMFHSTLIYLMGPDGAYRAMFRHSESPERMAEIILQHIKR